MAGIKNGIFSVISLNENCRRRRISMQKSDTGKITAAGFDNKDSTRNSRVSQYCFLSFESRYFVNAICPARKNKVYNTSFRSETHATDSTCKGCIANNKEVTNAISELFFGKQEGKPVNEITVDKMKNKIE